MYTVDVIFDTRTYWHKRHADVSKFDVIDGSLMLWRSGDQLPFIVYAKGVWQSIEII